MVALAPGCRCQGGESSGRAPAASASVQPARASASASAAPVPVLGLPGAAARRADEVVAVGVQPGGGLVAVRLRTGADGATESRELPGAAAIDRPTSIDVVASEGGVAIRVDERQGSGRRWRAVDWAGLGQAAAEETPGALCATATAVLGVRAGEGLQRWPFGPGAGEPTGELDARGAASLLCGERRAYVQRDDGLHRTVQALADGHLLGPAPLEARDDEQSSASVIDRDALVLARLTSRANRLEPLGVLSLRRWEADAPWPGPWREVPGPDYPGSLELLLARGPLVAAVLVTAVPADGCKNGETTHAVAELLVVDAERGRVRPRQRLDQWNCGAEPGPFGGGVTAAGFVVSWPRGADTACTRLGVRHSGLGFVVAPLDGGALRPGRREEPADDLLDLGCEASGCHALALTRGDGGGCWAISDERSHRPRLVAYP